jgi:hypothetical protein
MFCSVRMAYTTKGTEGGMRMPRVPPVAKVAVLSPPAYPWAFICGYATWVMVADVATEEPQTAPKAPAAMTDAMAKPPRTWPKKAAAA